MSRNTPKTSVIIRTKNEERFLPRVLEALKHQTYQNFETIVLDDNSTDKTPEIAKRYNCRIVNIPPGKFSHPYSCNLGAENAKGEYLVYLNGHSIPISETWLEDGLRNFQDRRVVGVCALPIAHEEGTLTDKLLWNIVAYTLRSIKHRCNRFSLDLLGTTNAIIRRDLWQKHKFDEEYSGGWGGEDRDLAMRIIRQGYTVIHDPKFKVRHSHLLKPTQIPWQIKNWVKMVTYRGIPEKQRRNF